MTLCMMNGDCAKVTGLGTRGNSTMNGRFSFLTIIIMTPVSIGIGK